LAVKETPANLSALPDDAVEVLRKALSGTTMVEAARFSTAGRKYLRISS
jgi:hypothetical protein